jgi:probable F420-dependent oxidoreductase
MRFGCSLIVRGHDATPETFLQMAAKAEATGLDALWCSAHIVLPPQVKSGYIGVPGRKYAEHWNERYWEPFTVLSYLAAHTTRVTLGTSIIVLPMHNPFEIAKQVAEVDHLSGGRFVLGVGVGWFEEEFEVLGQNFRNRGARMDDALRLMKALWADDPVTYEGKHYQVRDARFAPKPVQRPHPPIWVAGHSPATLRRVARYGDVWHPVRPTYEYVQQAQQELRTLAEQEGRAPERIRVAVKLPLAFQDGPPGEGQYYSEGRPQDIADTILRFRELGIEDFVFDFLPERRATALDALERFAQEVRPKL